VYAVILVVVVVGKDFTIIVVSKVALASAPPPNYSISNIHSGLPTYKYMYSKRKGKSGKSLKI
jgi:hypothetical protein